MIVDGSFFDLFPSNVRTMLQIEEVEEVWVELVCCVPFVLLIYFGALLPMLQICFSYFFVDFAVGLCTADNGKEA